MKNVSMYSASILFYLLFPFFVSNPNVKSNEETVASSNYRTELVCELDCNRLDPDPITKDESKKRRNPIFELCAQRCGEPVTLTSQICFQQCVQYYYFIFRGKL